MTTLAPIVLFVFARPGHTRQTLDALAANELAEQSDLIIYADAARNENEIKRVQEVRDIIHAEKDFRSVTVIERETNYGLARSIIDGVTQVCSSHGRVIVLEDDMVTSSCFLRYMNEALTLYEPVEKVISIHGYVYPLDGALPDTFFLRGADCWGWATWQRGWALFDSDGGTLLKQLKKRKLCRAFDFEGAYPYTAMLKAQIAGRNNSWAIRWYASAFLNEKLTLYPGRTLVHNIGNDNSGTHCGVTEQFSACLSDTPIKLELQALEENEMVRKQFTTFLHGACPSLISLIRKRMASFLKGVAKRCD